MGLQPGGSKPAKTFQWFKHRMWDEQAIADLKAGATRVGKLLGWVDDTEGEKAKQAAAAGEGDDGGVPSTQAG